MEFVTCLGEATESSARVEVQEMDGTAPEGLQGTLDGPTCAYSRTLPNRYEVTLRANDDGRQAVAEILVTEPCYWTPELPFLYQLNLQWLGQRGQMEHLVQTVGFRRLIARRGSLFWDSRRIVLRGAAVSSVTELAVMEARAAGAALIVPFPSASQVDLADRLGVALVADCRGDLPDFDKHVRRLSGRPSVALMLFDHHQIRECDLARLTPQAILACTAYPNDHPQFHEEGTMAPWFRVIVLELEKQMLPEVAEQASNPPVVAIRRGVPYADFHEARAACDQLQAELAPNFNLAGYFVSRE